MNSPKRFPLILAAVISISLTAIAAPPAGEVHILIKPKPGMSEVALDALLSAHGAKAAGQIPGINVRIVRIPAKAAAQVLAAFQKDGDLEYAEPDFQAQALATANDPYYTAGQEWHLAKIQAPAAWDVSTGSNNVIVAVVDTGVSTTHPDLAGKVLPGYDFINSDSDPADDNGHGTAAAGVAAASSNNSIGVAGVAWANPVLPVKVLDAAGSGSYSAIASGITYSADHGARVINLSLGGTFSSLALQDAVNYAWNKNIVVIAAAGNNGNDVPFYPAACTNVVAVSATNSSDTSPSWSNFGSYVDVSAPGENILSLSSADGYGYWSGTSFSSPMTAGITALMASANAQLTNKQIVDLLIQSADDIGTLGYDVYYGFGRVNASRAVIAAKNYALPDTTLPVVSIGSPVNGTTVAGTLNVTASATDNVGVTRSELSIDGVLVAQNAGSSIAYGWDTRVLADGVHTVSARGYDAAGNVGTKTVSVTVKNSADTTAPVVAITSPAGGTKIQGNTLKIAVSSSDNVGVSKVELYIDGKLFGTSTASSTTFTWSTNKVAAGSHALQAYAYDAAGNVGTSGVTTVTK